MNFRSMTDTTQRASSAKRAPRARREWARRWPRWPPIRRQGGAEAIVNQDRFLHGNIRTTCVATLLDGGRPQCAAAAGGRQYQLPHLPGHPIEEIKAELEKVIGDPGVTVTQRLPPKRPRRRHRRST